MLHSSLLNIKTRSQTTKNSTKRKATWNRKQEAKSKTSFFSFQTLSFTNIRPPLRPIRINILQPIFNVFDFVFVFSLSVDYFHIIFYLFKSFTFLFRSLCVALLWKKQKSCKDFCLFNHKISFNKQHNNKRDILIGYKEHMHLSKFSLCFYQNNLWVNICSVKLETNWILFSYL